MDLENAAPESDIHIYIKGEEDQLMPLVIELGIRYKYKYKNYLAVIVNQQQLESLALSQFVQAIHYEGGKGEALLQKTLINANVLPVHNGSGGLPAAYSGKDVIIGVIDAGLDLNHPDFQDISGKTRVLEYWDQTLSFGSPYTPAYGYGQVYDSSQINAGICPSVDQGIYFGHGTNITGIAASNGLATGNLKGVAPESDLIIVSSNFSAFGWTSTVADAVDYIFSRAEFYGKPCVINASLGTYLGSHDGRDFAAQLIDEDITASAGRAMVCAAGNAGDQAPFHLGYNVSADTNFTWFNLGANPSIGQANAYFEIYGDVGDMETIQFALGADEVSTVFASRGMSNFTNVQACLYNQTFDTIWSESGNYLGAVQTYSDTLNGTYRMQIYVNSIDSILYRYGLYASGNGRFDLWSASWLNGRDFHFTNLPTIAQFPKMANYKLPDISQSIVSSWACSDKVITVANFTNRISYTDFDGNNVVLTGQTEGNIAVNSSWGPSRTGVQKPEIAAPGDNTLTSGAAFQIANQLSIPNQRNRVAPGGMHNRAGGTSSASPVVAGVGALFFEKCSGKNWLDFRTAILENGKIDQYTGTVPNNRWGVGKVDALEVLNSTTPRPYLIADGNDFCDGEVFPIELSTAYDSILWNIGLSSIDVIASQSGLYYATVIDEYGCLGRSDTLSVFKRSNPLKPLIDVESQNIESCPNEDVVLLIEDAFGSYKWSNGDRTNSINVTEAGSFSCEVSNIFGCKNWSDTINVSFHPIAPLAVMHLKDDQKLHNVSDSNYVAKYLWYFNNTLLVNDTLSYLEPKELGVYKAAYIDSFGCEYVSPSYSLFILSDNSLLEKSLIKVYPNPFVASLRIESEEMINNCTLMNSLGQIILSKPFNSKRAMLDVNNLGSGVYFLEVENESKVNRIKVVKE